MANNTAKVEQIEVKARAKKWPWALGSGVAAIVVAAGLVGMSAQGEAPVFQDEIAVAINPTNVPAELVSQYIADEIAPELGLKIELRHFADYTEINRATDSGEIAANYAQNVPFLNDQITAFDFNIESITTGFSTAAVVASSKYSSLDEIPDDARLAIRDDPAGQARAVLVLQDLGLVTLEPEAGDLPQISDIAENHKNIDFHPVAIGSISRAYEEMDLIAGYYADFAAAVPVEDILGHGDVREGWEQLLVVNSDHKDDPGIQALKKAYEDPRVVDWIENHENPIFKDLLGQQAYGPVEKE